MLELFKLLAGAAVLAALGALPACSSVPSPDQKLGVTIAVPGFGSLDVGYSSGKAIANLAAPSSSWTVTPAGHITTNPADIIPQENPAATAAAKIP